MASSDAWRKLGEKVDDTYTLLAMEFGVDHPIVQQLVVISDTVADGTEAAARREHPEWFEGV